MKKDIVYVAVPINKKNVFHEAILLEGHPMSAILTQSRAIDDKIRVYDINSKTTRLVGKWQIYSKGSVDQMMNNYMSDRDNQPIDRYENRRGV